MKSSPIPEPNIPLITIIICSLLLDFFSHGRIVLFNISLPSGVIIVMVYWIICDANSSLKLKALTYTKWWNCFRHPKSYFSRMRLISLTCRIIAIVRIQVQSDSRWWDDDALKKKVNFTFYVISSIKKSNLRTFACWSNQKENNVEKLFLMHLNCENIQNSQARCQLKN